LVAAAQEERFTRKKHDAAFPVNAIRYCLSEGGITPEAIDYIGFYDKPWMKFERLLSTYMQTFPRGYSSFRRAMPVWMKEKLWIPRVIERELGVEKEVFFTEHHESHAASAFLLSPFERAAILTLDGVGEWATASYGVGEGNRFELLAEIHFPHSLGLLYSAFTYYLGFKVNSAEYKVMGLAPYGEPRFVDLIREKIFRISEDGSFRMNMDLFAFEYGLTMTNRKFAALFGRPRREPESELEPFHMDVAASVQKVTEEVVLRMGRMIHEKTGEENLCMAGGVALNCVANGRLLREGPFKQLYIQPAAGDAGGAVGVAAFIHHTLLGNPRKGGHRSPYLGPAFSTEEIRRYLEAHEISYETYDPSEIPRVTARLLAHEDAVVGWFQGRMEFGPRALGARSIIADPRKKENWQRVNLKIKFRESFRPFAPSVLVEDAGDYFELDRE
ncbi:MAG: hypothetical protein D6795_15010, partial [Deltaproteobacteria bacterium]